MNETPPLTYKDAGVDIDAQEAALAAAKAAVRSTFTPGVLSDVGLFGGLFDPERVDCGGQVLVASADGVGTKLEVAARAGVYDTVGRDLVNHCVDDVLVQGARPLFFLDYVGTGRLEPDVVAGLIRGCAEGCRENGMALLGGETAEMPGLYAEGDFDLVGFVVGAVPRERILDGSAVQPGQALLGLRSSGLHTNGYSLARKVLFERLGLGLDDRPDELEGRTVAEALLAPHRSYLAPVHPLCEEGLVAAIAHVTGGGLVDNLPRVVRTCDAVVDRGAWTPPGLFRLVVEGGGVPEEDAYRTFNMGIGMVLVVDPSNLDRVRARLADAGEEAIPLGETAPARGDAGVVRWA